MNSACSINKLSTTRQGRGTELSWQHGLLFRPYRSLNPGLGQLCSDISAAAPLRRCLTIAFLLLLLCVPTFAQDLEDTIRINTRVVFVDTLVKDKKTNLPITNLTTDNFEVLDNGKPRQLSYFSREGQARKPLALVLILDVREDSAGRFLKKAEVLKSMEDEQLPNPNKSLRPLRLCGIMPHPCTDQTKYLLHSSVSFLQQQHSLKHEESQQKTTSLSSLSATRESRLTANSWLTF